MCDIIHPGKCSHSVLMGFFFLVVAVSRAGWGRGWWRCGCVTWWQVLAVAAGVDQNVGVEGGVEPFVSTAARHR